MTELIDFEYPSMIAYPNPRTGILNFGTTQKWILQNSFGMFLDNGKGPSLDLSTYPSGMFLLKFGDKMIRVLKE